MESNKSLLLLFQFDRIPLKRVRNCLPVIFLKEFLKKKKCLRVARVRVRHAPRVTHKR